MWRCRRCGGDVVEMWWRCVDVEMCRCGDVEMWWRCGGDVEKCRCGDV